MTIFKEGVKAWEAALAFGKFILVIGGPAGALNALCNVIDKRDEISAIIKSKRNKYKEK